MTGNRLLIVFLPVALGAQDSVLRLSLKRAVELATSPEGNTRLQLAGELARQAESRSSQARAALLPNLDSSISQQSVTRNLAALGVRFDLPIPGVRIPTFVGPFNVFDVRATATQSVFDFSSIRRYQASRAGLRAARTEVDTTTDQVAAQVAKTYLAALRAEADLEAARANVTLAEAILKQTENLKAAGSGTGLEVTRARVQLANERQRLLVVQNDRRRARLQLLRAMNLRLDTDFELTDRLGFSPVDAETIAQVRKCALETRPDYKAQLERQQNARLASSATRMERLPSLAAFADYGSIGSSVSNALPTRTYGLALRVPLFDGGRRDARRAESASQLRQESIRTADLRDQIGLEIELALDALRSAVEQVKVAQEGLQLAENELNQARRRYDAGVANSLEVTDAQSRLARARDNHTVALFLHAQARLDLGQATGTLRRFLE